MPNWQLSWAWPTSGALRSGRVTPKRARGHGGHGSGAPLPPTGAAATSGGQADVSVARWPPVGRWPNPPQLCENVPAKVAQCVADPQLLEVSIGRLLAVIRKLTEEQQTHLKTGAKARLGAAVWPMVMAERCQKPVAGGRWIRPLDANAVYAALGGSCVQLGAALGTAQGIVIQRSVPRANDPRPRRK